MIYPYIFIDTDKQSETYLQYSIMVSDSLSLDGYKTIIEALDALKKVAA